MSTDIRECGACTMCCWALEIDASPVENLPESDCFQWCAHCSSTGCAIHKNKPSLCSDWDCLWVKMLDWDASEQPLQCGVIWRYTYTRFKRVPQAIECTEGALLGAVVQARIKSFLMNRCRVLTYDMHGQQTYWFSEDWLIDPKTIKEIKEAGLLIKYLNIY